MVDRSSRIDWNLIPALDALLIEQNVSRAARRLGVTQPTMSNALARLRRHFGDDLLTRHGNTYVLTPLAERLAAPVHEAVTWGTSVVTSAAEFDPAESTREFIIAASDYIQAVLMPRLLREIRRQAPSVIVTVVAPFTEPYRTGEDIIASTDGWIAPQEMLPGEHHSGLLTDEWVCVVSEDHPTVGDELTMADVAALPWVSPTIRGTSLRLFLDSILAHGVEPTIEASIENFTAIPFLVAGTDRISIMQRSLAELFAEAAGIRVLECPWGVQPLKVTLWWDGRFESDPAHTGLREVINAAMRDTGCE